MNEQKETTTKKTIETINPNELLLQVWPSEWNLPSLDADCLTVMCYLKFSGLDFKIDYVKNPFLLFKNSYPRLIHKNVTFVGLNEIISYIKTIQNNDLSLNDRNYADMLALVNLFREKFLPPFVDLCWLNQENTYTVIRSAYGKYLRFPLSMFKLKIFAKSAENYLSCNYKSEYVQYDSIKNKLLNDAKECLNVLNTTIGDRIFMFENQPTLIDAYIYGYLSVLYKAPFMGSALKNHLLASKNLCSLINRINIEYFTVNREDLQNKQIPTAKASSSSSSKQNEQKTNKNNNKSKKTNESNYDDDETTATNEAEYENKNEDYETLRDERKQQIMAICVAISAMLIYAFAIGFIKIEIQSTEIVNEPINVD